MPIIPPSLAGYTPRIIGEELRLQSAVCIPLIPNGDSYDILLEVRSSSLPDQPGDICLPGGMMEAGEDRWETALRETCEELLISPEQLSYLGPSDIFDTDSLMIYPFAAILKDYQNTYSRDEVAEILRVPLDFFLNTKPDTHMVKCVYQPGEDFPYDRIQGGRNYRWRSAVHTHLFYYYEGHTIWGMTALVLNSFAEVLRKHLK